MAQRTQQRSKRETNANALKVAMWRLLDKKTVSTGDVVYPCVPSLAEQYANRLVTAWSALGRPFSSAEVARLSSLLERAMTDGRKRSPLALVRVHYEAEPPPQGTLQYQIQIVAVTPETHYEGYRKHRATNLFGVHADAKLIQVARMVQGEAPRAIDVGAGTGRNAIELARRGFVVDAVEVVSDMCTELRSAADGARVSVNVIDADFLEMDIPAGSYELAVLSEVATQLDEDQVDAAFKKAAAMLRPGGYLLLNLFLASDGFRPDSAMREFSLCSLCRVYTRAELKSLIEDLPLKSVSDESALEFEREHLPPEAWPPTTWFESWALGSNLFDVPVGSSPFELRWLLYQRL